MGFSSSTSSILRATLFVLLLAVLVHAGPKKAPKLPLQFFTTVKMGEHLETRYVDYENQRIRVDNPKGNSSTFIFPKEKIAYFYQQGGKKCRKSPFFGSLKMDFELDPRSAVFLGRNKAPQRKFNCDYWKQDGPNECVKFCLNVEHPNKLKTGINVVMLDSSVTKILPMSDDLEKDRVLLVHLALYSPGNCDGKPLRTIHYLNFTPGPQDSKLFELPGMGSGCKT